MAYHYGQTIKKYRELHGWTQARLAERWPKGSIEKNEGVNTRYVQDVEHGRKRIGNPETLREISKMLSIPLQEFGLSEHNPFDPSVPEQRSVMYPEILGLVENHIRQIWSLRCAARIPDAEQGVSYLTTLFAFFVEQHLPPAHLERHFHLLHAQVKRLSAVTAVEKKHYSLARTTYEHIIESVKHLESSASLAIALMELGKELERNGEKQEAIALLEHARDVSLRSSKRVMAFVHSYLARGYASCGDTLRFERTITTGLDLARMLPSESTEDDFVYSWAPVSALLAEKSWGYLNTGQPQKTLDMRKEIEQAIEQNQDSRLYAWIPLDWAHAYLQLGEPEEGITAARTFYARAKAMQSPHAVSKAYTYLDEVEKTKYAHVAKDFREELGPI